MSAVKEAVYRIHNRPARVGYLVQGRDIYFSSLEKNGATINWAEAVVSTICQAEGIRWSDYTFYDIQTNTGFFHDSDPGYYTIDRLVIELQGNYLQVVGWEPVAKREYGQVVTRLGQRTLPGIPLAVYEAFRHLIV